jgi:hypothetical protein
MSVGGASLDGDAFVTIANAATVHYSRTVQVDPINPTLNARGTQRLKLKSDELLSNLAFKFILCRYTMTPSKRSPKRERDCSVRCEK